MTLTLQGFCFDLKYIRGDINICDYSSRHPFKNLKKHLTTTKLH